MNGAEYYGFLWWLIPIVMILFCFFMMRGVCSGGCCNWNRRNEGFKTDLLKKE